MTLTLNDLIPTKMANNIKELCRYTCDGEFQNYKEWLMTSGDADESYGHIYELASHIQNWINKEVPFQVLLDVGRVVEETALNFKGIYTILNKAYI